MARTKNEVLTIRTTAEVKELLKLAAERERRFHYFLLDPATDPLHGEALPSIGSIG